MTVENIKSSFLITGGFPFNPSAFCSPEEMKNHLSKLQKFLSFLLSLPLQSNAEKGCNQVFLAKGKVLFSQYNLKISTLVSFQKINFQLEKLLFSRGDMKMALVFFYEKWAQITHLIPPGVYTENARRSLSLKQIKARQCGTPSSRLWLAVPPAAVCFSQFN